MGIKVKLKVCLVCGNKKPIWTAGVCKNCAIAKSKPLSKGGNIKKSYKRKKEGYSEFYLDEIRRHSDNPYSIATNAYIATVGTTNIAHIFPKEKYKSVSRNRDNIILLTWEEHARFDELLNSMKFSTLEVEFKSCWEKICNQVEILLPLITENGALVRNFKTYIDGKH